MSEIRDPVTHNLKILPEHYSAVCAGVKRAELRKNDRDYRAGDTLDLCEWDKDDESFTGNYISVTVTHVADVSEWMPGYVLLSIELALRERAEPVAYADPQAFRNFQTGTATKEWMWAKPDAGLVPVFVEAPPAPVVPDEVTAEDVRWMLKQADHDDGPKCRIEHAEYIGAMMWNACRTAMLQGAEPVSSAYKLPMGYMQGLKDGLEWAARLAEANNPSTGDWLYDDPLELAKAIRKGPDVPAEPSHGWIPCSERMPDEGAEVYIFCDGEWVLEAQYREGDFYDVVRDGSEIFETVSRCVSHWQLRPQRPAAPGKN